MKRKVCVITGSRAEYGILKPLLKQIKKDKEMKLQLVVTGMHLSWEFGLTYREIEKDGFVIDERVKILTTSDTAASITTAMGRAMIGLSQAYTRLKPDAIVVLGDRFEIFSAAASAVVNKIPLVHIGGGELTEGVFDESFRHSITKMSYLHFVSTEEYRRRVIQLGEEPRRVFNVGHLGLDNIRTMKLLSHAELEKSLGVKFLRRNVLVTFHPVTLADNSTQQFKNLLAVLDKFKDMFIIFTKANADTGGRDINRMTDEYVDSHPSISVAFTSLGQLRYLSLMQFMDAVVGNSSSGILEAPSFHIGTINIGDRQKGRIRARSIIDCEPSKKSIREAFRKIYSAAFQKSLKQVENPYGDGRTSTRIMAIMKKFDFCRATQKSFYNFRRG